MDNNQKFKLILASMLQTINTIYNVQFGKENTLLQRVITVNLFFIGTYLKNKLDNYLENISNALQNPNFTNQFSRC
jgi:hypothetical protein